MAFREVDRDLADMYYSLRGAREYDTAPILPVEGGRAKLEGKLAAINARIANLPDVGAAGEIYKSHFVDFSLLVSRRIRDMYEKPALVLGELADVVSNATLIDSRGADERCDVVIKRLSQAREIRDMVLPRLNGLTQNEIAAFASEIGYFADCISHYTDEIDSRFGGNDKIGAALTGAASVLSEAADTARSMITEAIKPGSDERTMGMSEDEYRAVLNDELGVKLDDLREWSASEVEKTRSEALELASRLTGRNIVDMGEVTEILNKYAGPADTPDEMFRRTRDYMNRTREASREYVKFPDEICRLEEVPYILRDSFPWGGYCDGDFRAMPPMGMVILNQYNFRAVTDGWMKIQAAHEAYPGHHVQYVRAMTDPRPETAKIGAKYIPLIEGTAHRSERLMEGLFAEDKWYPLFTAYRRHHTSVRICVDMLLRADNRPASEAMRMYARELGFSENVARGQVLAHERMQGYFTCYYYGLKRITDMERASKLDEKQFTEALFSVGNVSLDNLEKYLALNDADRKSYENDFKSLMMK